VPGGGAAQELQLVAPRVLATWQQAPEARRADVSGGDVAQRGEGEVGFQRGWAGAGGPWAVLEGCIVSLFNVWVEVNAGCPLKFCTGPQPKEWEGN